MKTILVVDDEPRLRELYRDALEDEGYRVVEAESGAAAIEALKTCPADLAILDLRMPGIHGLELLTRLHMSHPALPVILCSGIGALFDDYAVWEARDQVVGKFTKPVSLADLVQSIRETLEPVLPATSI